MALSIKHLNADTSWLLTFTPPCASGHDRSASPNAAFPGSFTILVDPWLVGPSKVWSSKFAITHRVIPACIDSLTELPEPDLIVVSQDKSDHCNEQTLKQLSPDFNTTIVGPLAAAKKIRSWKYFDTLNVQALKRYDAQNEDTILRIPIPPFSSTGTPGEVTVCLLANKVDVTGLHNAIGITYRAPSSVFTETHSYVKLPITPPATPPESPPAWSTTPTGPLFPARATVNPSPLGNREKTVSVIYSPHGIGYQCIKPYATSHLLSEAALPLAAFFHCFDRTTNPWYLGGNVCAGFPNGVEIAHNLYARTWIGAHDEEKSSKGMSTKRLRVEKYRPDEIQQQLEQLSGTMKQASHTAVIEIGVGEEYIVPTR